MLQRQLHIINSSKPTASTDNTDETAESSNLISPQLLEELDITHIYAVTQEHRRLSIIKKARNEIKTTKIILWQFILITRISGFIYIYIFYF